MNYYMEPMKRIPALTYDVVVAGAGTAGVMAAIAAARNGAKTIVIELKGYPGGIAGEGGTALHSFYNVWKPYDDVAKTQLVKGIPQELIDRLMTVGGCSGHSETTKGYDYDSVSTGIDTELYKLTAFEMLDEAGVTCMMNTMVVDAIVEEGVIEGVIIENRGGRQAIMAKSFIDTTGHGDLSALAGAEYTEPADYSSANSMGVGGVNVEAYYQYLVDHNAIGDVAYGIRSGEANKLVRVTGGETNGTITDPADTRRLPDAVLKKSKAIGMSYVTTTVHDDYFMFIKLNHHLGGPSTDVDKVNAAELELRKRQYKALKLFRDNVPGCEKAFIARTTPSLNVRRGRCITCDYDMPLSEILDATNYEDDVFTYGFHDCAPRLHIKHGGSYGLPYRALCVKGLKNLYAAGMMITSDWEAHMSTRNTVSCMGMGQAAGTAAALCVKEACSIRELPYSILRETLVKDNVYLEPQI